MSSCKIWNSEFTVNFLQLAYFKHQFNKIFLQYKVDYLETICDSIDDSGAEIIHSPK